MEKLGAVNGKWPDFYTLGGLERIKVPKTRGLLPFDPAKSGHIRPKSCHFRQNLEFQA